MFKKYFKHFNLNEFWDDSGYFSNPILLQMIKDAEHTLGYRLQNLILTIKTKMEVVLLISDKSQKWIEAGIILAGDSWKKVVCPACEKDNLGVLDVRIESYPNMIERIIYCPVCGEKNYIRLKHPL